MNSIYNSEKSPIPEQTSTTLTIDPYESISADQATSTPQTSSQTAWFNDPKYQFQSIVEVEPNPTVAAPQQPAVDQSTVNQEMLTQLLADTDHYHLKGSNQQKSITSGSKRHECTAAPRTFYERIGVNLEFWGNNASTATEAKFTHDPNWELVYSSNYGPSVNQWEGKQPGDICVQFAYNGDGKSTSHGCMYDGRNWVSDFRQRNCWVYGTGSSRQAPQGAVQVWRYKPLHNQPAQTISQKQGGILTWADSSDYESFDTFIQAKKFQQGGELSVYQSQKVYLPTEDTSDSILFNDPETSNPTVSVSQAVPATDWFNDSKYQFAEPVEVPTVTTTTETTSDPEISNTSVTGTRIIKPKGKNEARDRMIAAIVNLGVDEVTATALAVQTGGESNYNPALDSGIGGWVPSTRGKVIDAINEHFGTHYDRPSFKKIPLEHQAWALVNRYYLPYKSKVDAIPDLYGKAEAFAKIGFAPAIFSQSSWTDKKGLTAKTKGKTYRDTPEDWFRYLVDTGNVTWGTTNWHDHFAHRIKAHGWELA